MPDDRTPPPPGCRGDRDGDCSWKRCPQFLDAEPYKSGRHCPLDVDHDDWGDPNPEHVRRRDFYLANHPTFGG